MTATLTVSEAARALGITTSAVRHLVRRGRLATVRVDERTYLVTRDSVEAFRVSRCQRERA